MSATLTVRDETTFAFGGEEREFTLDFRPRGSRCAS